MIFSLIREIVWPSLFAVLLFIAAVITVSVSSAVTLAVVFALGSIAFSILSLRA